MIILAIRTYRVDFIDKFSYIGGFSGIGMILIY